ncbi:MAG: DUF1801 domain-containing protein, partial [Acidimicrobiales bacterium]
MTNGAEPKDVTEFVDGIQDEARREDCRALTGLMREITGEEPRLWGSSMVGFGTYHYRYASGREGDWFKVGFASRKSNLTLYLMSGMVGYDDLLAGLGPHKTGKSCIYVKRLEDLDLKVLTALIERSVAHVNQVEDGAGGLP